MWLRVSTPQTQEDGENPQAAREFGSPLFPRSTYVYRTDIQAVDCLPGHHQGRLPIDNTSALPLRNPFQNPCPNSNKRAPQTMQSGRLRRVGGQCGYASQFECRVIPRRREERFRFSNRDADVQLRLFCRFKFSANQANRISHSHQRVDDIGLLSATDIPLIRRYCVARLSRFPANHDAW